MRDKGLQILDRRFDSDRRLSCKALRYNRLASTAERAVRHLDERKGGVFVTLTNPTGATNGATPQ